MMAGLSVTAAAAVCPVAARALPPTASPAKIREISDVPIEIDYGPVEFKHAYWLPLDKPTRQKFKALSRPYPKTQPEVAN